MPDFSHIPQPDREANPWKVALEEEMGRVKNEIGQKIFFLLIKLFFS